MSNQWTYESYARAVHEGNWPQTPRVPLEEPFVNAAGVIQNLLLQPSQSAAVIHSQPHAMRANHYHKTDWHYSYVLTGSILYGWKSAEANETLQLETFERGSMFFTPPLVTHVMYFPEPTVFLTLARNSRDHESHEDDVVRVEPLLIKNWSPQLGRFDVEPA